MAHTKSQQKHCQVSEERRQHNASRRSRMRTLLKKSKAALEEKTGIQANFEDALAAYKRIQAVLDRYATKGLIHKNKASRHKSKITAKLKSFTAETITSV